jgi:hypothetical protein
MGYRWIENPHPDLPFDLVVFKPDATILVKVRLTRNPIDPEGFYETMFPDEVAGLRLLPFPQLIPRELWLKTRGEYVWRRLHVMPVGVGEIEWLDLDKYVNPHVRREEPELVGPTGKFIVTGSQHSRSRAGNNPPKRVPEK